ncbi:MAG: matrixin family metalloprotease [Bacteroidota bacterium]
MDQYKSAFLLLLVFLLHSSCEPEPMADPPSPVEDRTYAICNSSLPDCMRSTGEYCLFGYKWGEKPAFDPRGIDLQGPEAPGGVVTYSFQESNGTINTHRQVGLESKSFDELLDCARSELKHALDTWTQAANISFQEQPDNSESDIRFFVADIIQSGIGYPNYDLSACQSLKGTLIIQSDIAIFNCDDFYIFALHELGHVLGLGHVRTANVMNPDFFDYEFEGLQSGDLKGIVEIYGEK